MSDFLQVNLEEVDLSFRLPEPGEYKAQICDYEFKYDDNNNPIRIVLTMDLLEGDEDSLDLQIKDNIMLNHEIGMKKLKSLALATGVAFDNRGVDMSEFIDKEIGITIIHKPGKTGDVMFANVKKYFELETPTDIPTDIPSEESFDTSIPPEPQPDSDDSSSLDGVNPPVPF